MRIKELRKQKGLSQTELAHALSLEQTTISSYEQEKTEPNISTLIKLADYYNVSLDYLCGRVWHNQIGYIPDDKKDLVNLVLQLNELNTIRATSYIAGMLAIQNN